MPFVAKSAAQIRDLALADWRARYLAHDPPRDLDITEGGDAWNLVDALSLEFEGVEIAAQEAAHRVLLRFAFGGDLDDFAEDDGTSRIGASKARRTVTILGAPLTSSPIAGATLSSADGQVFVPIDPVTGFALTATPVTDVAGYATVTVEATVAGTAANALPIGTVLTWSSAPTGFSALATLGALVVSGEADESDNDLRTRLLRRRRERPNGSNRSYWHEVFIRVAGVGEVFVYRAMASPAFTPDDDTAHTLGVYDYRPNRLGNTTVIPIAPPPTSYAEDGDGMVSGYSRVPSYQLIQTMRGYLRGTTSAAGGTGDGTELYPAHSTVDHFFVVPPRPYERDVVVSVTAASGWRWLPGSNTTGVGVSTATLLYLTLPIATWVVGDRVAIQDWSGHRTRGGWFLRQIVARDTVARTVTLDAPLPGIPPLGTNLYPDAVGPANASLWRSMLTGTADGTQDGIACLFDRLGPGAGPPQTFRFPEVTDSHPPDLTRGSLLRVALDSPGVADASITLPATTQYAPVGGLFVLREFRVERA